MIAVRKLIESLKIGLQKGVNNIMIKKKEVIYVTNDTPNTSRDHYIYQGRDVSSATIWTMFHGN